MSYKPAGKRSQVFFLFCFLFVCFVLGRCVPSACWSPCASDQTPTTAMGSDNVRSLTCCAPGNSEKSVVFLFKIFFFLAAPWHIWSPYMTDLSHSYNLYCSCSSAGSFNPLCQAGDWTYVPVLQRCRQSCCATVGIPRSQYFWSALCLIVKLSPVSGGREPQASQLRLSGGRPSATQTWGWWEMRVACSSQKEKAGSWEERSSVSLLHLPGLELHYAGLAGEEEEWGLLWIP